MQQPAANTYQMKLQILVFLPAIFLILPYYKAWKPSEPVYDTVGNELISGEEYDIIPSDGGRSRGGITVTQHNTSWPLFIAQDDSLLTNGNPVIIIPVTNNHPEKHDVRVSSNVRIQFVSRATSLEPMMWKIGDREGASGRRHIVAVDVRDDHAHNNNNIQFIIQKHITGDYELVHCPKVCKLCRSACQNVGIFIEGGSKWLGLEGLPLTIAFKKNNFDE